MVTPESEKIGGGGSGGGRWSDATGEPKMEGGKGSGTVGEEGE